ALPASLLIRRHAVDSAVIADHWQRIGIEWQSPARRYLAHVEQVDDRNAAIGVPDHHARHPVNAGELGIDRHKRQAVAIDAGAERGDRAAGIDEKSRFAPRTL